MAEGMLETRFVYSGLTEETAHSLVKENVFTNK